MQLADNRPMDLTILLVTRDRPVLLEQSIRSIQASAQAAESVVTTRILVVDDSAVGSAEAVSVSLGVDYARNPVRVERNGLSAARAWAIARIDTDLVAMFDDDDLMLEDHIGRLARHIRDGADICPTGYWYADPDPGDVTKLIPRATPARPREPRLGDLLAGYQPVNDGAMMRTEVAKSVVWDPGREILMMYDIWLQLLFAGRRFVVNRTPTFLYRQHPTSMSHNLGEREAVIRSQLIAEARNLAIQRYGYVPRPALSIQLALAWHALGRAIART
jgi:glycosyltransferase involved in cell wall biosynthesis